jgi:hypothetical protein
MILVELSFQGSRRRDPVMVKFLEAPREGDTVHFDGRSYIVNNVVWWVEATENEHICDSVRVVVS